MTGSCWVNASGKCERIWCSTNHVPLISWQGVFLVRNFLLKSSCWKVLAANCLEFLDKNLPGRFAFTGIAKWHRPNKILNNIQWICFLVTFSRKICLSFCNRYRVFDLRSSLCGNTSEESSVRITYCVIYQGVTTVYRQLESDCKRQSYWTNKPIKKWWSERCESHRSILAPFIASNVLNQNNNQGLRLLEKPFWEELPRGFREAAEKILLREVFERTFWEFSPKQVDAFEKGIIPLKKYENSIAIHLSGKTFAFSM